MGIVAFFLLGLGVVAAIVYPLAWGQRGGVGETTVSAEEIDRAVRALRRSRRNGLMCPACGRGYQAGDRFCVACGGALPVSSSADAGPVCPSCGASLRLGDRFCARCGHRMADAEVSL